ncbi:MAG: methanethiol S-methyltransferase [Planctomycetota bacterium]
MRAAVLGYGVAAYAVFLVTFVYAMGFVANVGVPKSIDSGPRGPVWTALLVNAALLMVFVVQHTIMARPAFKRWWIRFVPKAMERSTFVLLASAALALMMWQWRPIGGTVWAVEGGWLRGPLMAVSAAGWGLVLYASFLIDHFDLFGLRQVWLHFRGRPYTMHPFTERSLYRRVRHPLMLGFLIAFWATPLMSAGHLFFAVLVTGYVLVGIWFEERDLLRHLGPAYAAYRQRTPMLVPWRRVQRAEVPASAAGAALERRACESLTEPARALRSDAAAG